MHYDGVKHKYKRSHVIGRHAILNVCECVKAFKQGNVLGSLSTSLVPGVKRAHPSSDQPSAIVT